MKKNQTLRTAALISTGAALMVACTDTQDIPVDPNQPTTNADGKYNIIFITTDQEACMEQYPAGSDYAPVSVCARLVRHSRSTMLARMYRHRVGR